VTASPDRAADPVALVSDAGPLTLVEDAGRPGWRRDGVSPSGAFDRRALRLANQIVGNAEGSAVLEVTLGGLVLEWLDEAVVAVTGADAVLRLDGRQVDRGRALRPGPGSILRIGRARAGLRCYLAVRGGVGAEPVLGSRSADVFGGLGPPALRAGDPIRLAGDPTLGPPRWQRADLPELRPEIAVTVHPGPRADWFAPESLARMFAGAYAVTPDSNRTALRLAGPRLTRIHDRELEPEPVIRGAIQVPGSGRPLVFGPDHPVTGGYPVVAVVDDADTDALAQLRPGQQLRFRRAR
jgi:biotin-dependent carboxylase-like uncharacterized protein